MPVQQNKWDFDKAVEAAKESLEEMKGVVDKALLDPIENMFSEYEGHLKGDIEEMITADENREPDEE